MGLKWKSQHVFSKPECRSTFFPQKSRRKPFSTILCNMTSPRSTFQKEQEKEVPHTWQRYLNCPSFHRKLLSYWIGTPYAPLGLQRCFKIISKNRYFRHSRLGTRASIQRKTGKLPFSWASSWVLECCGASVVIDEVSNTLGRVPHLPPLRQRIFLHDAANETMRTHVSGTTHKWTHGPCTLRQRKGRACAPYRHVTWQPSFDFVILSHVSPVWGWSTTTTRTWKSRSA